MPQPQEPVSDSSQRQGSSQAESIPERSMDATQQPAGPAWKKRNPSRFGTVNMHACRSFCYSSVYE